MFCFLKRMLKYFLYFFWGLSILTTGLIIYLVWLQPPFYFPKPTGKHAVGVKTYHWIDATRKEIFADDSEHPNRELMVKIWYPSSLLCIHRNLGEDGNSYDGTGPAVAFGAHTASSTVALREDCELVEESSTPTTPWAPYLVKYMKENQKLAWIIVYSRPIYSYALPNKTFATATSLLPIIIFSHGYGCTCDSNTAQCEELASQGYIVVGISHTYCSSVVQFPDGRIADGMKAMARREKRLFKEKKERIDQEIEIWESDVHFVLDKLEQINNDKESFFYQKMDVGNIGILGHSFGGAVAAQICCRDLRVKAGVSLDGVFHGSDITRDFHKPFMFLLAGDVVQVYKRSWESKDWKKFGINSQEEEKWFRSKYLSSVEMFMKSIGFNSYAFVITNADHMAFCDNVLAKQISLFSYFMDNFGTGSINGFRMTKIVNAYLVNFFDKYIKGKPSELLDGDGKKYEEVKKLE